MAAGTFANVLTAILFFGSNGSCFLAYAFAPAGAEFNTYSYSIVGLAGINYMNNISIDNPNL